MQEIKKALYIYTDEPVSLRASSDGLQAAHLDSTMSILSSYLQLIGRTKDAKANETLQALQETYPA